MVHSSGRKSRSKNQGIQFVPAEPVPLMSSLDQLATVASEGEEETNNISNRKLIQSKEEQMDVILSESFDDGNSEKGRNAHEVNGIEKNILTGINVEKTDDVFTEGTIDNDKDVNDRGDTANNVSGEVNKERIYEGKPAEDEAPVDGLNNYNASTGDEGEHVNNFEKASDVDTTLVKELKADKQENCKETAEAKTSVKVNKKRNKIRKKKALRTDEILSESFHDGNQEKGRNSHEVNDIEKNISTEINVARTKNVFAQERTIDDDDNSNKINLFSLFFHLLPKKDQNFRTPK